MKAQKVDKNLSAMRMNVALLIDSLETKGGGEKIAYYIARRYNADIYTGAVEYDKILPGFRDFKISVLGKIRKSMFLRPETLLRGFRSLDLSRYDVIICLGAGYSYFAAVKSHPVIWYSFGISPLFYSAGTEMQKFWPLGKFYFKPMIWIWKLRIQEYDRKTMHSDVDTLVVPSKFTGKIIKRYYSRDVEQIYPPIETKRFYNSRSKGYYLVVSRLVPEKRVDLAVMAFREMPERMLYVEGTGPDEAHLKELAGGAKNIRFLGRVTSNSLLKLYAECTALVNLPYYQDINIVMMEALASGKPCIVVKQGAFSEIIKEGKNGVFVDDTVRGVIKGVNTLTLEKADAMKKECLKSAAVFDLSNFYKRWDSVIRKSSGKPK